MSNNLTNKDRSKYMKNSIVRDISSLHKEKLKTRYRDCLKKVMCKSKDKITKGNKTLPF